MNPTGGSDDDLLVRARSVLVDAPLAAHRHSVVVIGAQAIYLHTGSAPVAVAEATKDSDLGIDLRTLARFAAWRAIAMAGRGRGLLSARGQGRAVVRHGDARGLHFHGSRRAGAAAVRIASVGSGHRDIPSSTLPPR